MSAVIRRFRSRSNRLLADRAKVLRAALVSFRDGDGFSMPEPVQRAMVARWVADLDRHTVSSEGRCFLMLYPEDNLLVVRELRRASSRPAVACELWALCLGRLAVETGEVLASRAELAAELGVSAAVVSRLMGELVKLGAVSRLQAPVEGLRGRGAVRYFVNPNVGTHLSGKARDDAQSAARRVLPFPRPTAE